MEIFINKTDKVIIVPHGTLQALPIDEIKKMGFTIDESPVINNPTTKFFNKNRKKNKKTNYKK